MVEVDMFPALLQYLCCRLTAMVVGGEVVFLLHLVTTLLDMQDVLVVMISTVLLKLTKELLLCSEDVKLSVQA